MEPDTTNSTTPLEDARPSRNDALVARAERRIPGGVSSNVRLLAPRVFFERGKGAWLWDVDGRDYVDYLLGQGPNFLGHAPASVLDAVERASRRGMVFGAQHPLEVEAAELFCETVGWPEQVRFGVSGTESVQAALRLARAATGRRLFVRFEGHYHGWLDNVLATLDEAYRTVPASAGQLASQLDDCITLPWNDAEALERALAEHGSDVAAVIMEPVMLNQGSIEPRAGYLESVRTLCSRHGSVLIFDEVISGFRLSLGGAAARYGVTPDLAIYGKALAGGWPVSALAGSAELMAPFGTGAVTHAGTFNASVMAMAAVVAAITMLRDDPPYARIEAHGSALAKGLLERAHAHDIPLRIQGVPMAFHASFGDATPVYDARGLDALDRVGYAAFTPKLAEHGVWVAGRGIWYTSAAHGDAELEAALSRAEDAFAEGVDA
jgi:glutamate-1-semialdehyde 2,1-aminomutase